MSVRNIAQKSERGGGQMEEGKEREKDRQRYRDTER